MLGGCPFDQSKTIITRRLSLALLRVKDAEDMAGVLDDKRLHEFTGGQPATIGGLRDRYVRLAAGSPKPDEVWLNWIVRRRSDAQPIGTVQATLTTRDGHSTANAAWVIGVDWQNQGFASEAARALIDWLQQHSVGEVIAHIHPDHRASAVVATRAGLHPTEEQAGGEQVWRVRDGRDRPAPDGGDGPPSKTSRSS